MWNCCWRPLYDIWVRLSATSTGQMLQVLIWSRSEPPGLYLYTRWWGPHGLCAQFSVHPLAALCPHTSPCCEWMKGWGDIWKEECFAKLLLLSSPNMFLGEGTKCCLGHMVCSPVLCWLTPFLMPANLLISTSEEGASHTSTSNLFQCLVALWLWCQMELIYPSL